MYSETFDKVIKATSSLKTKTPKVQTAAIKDKFLPVLAKKAGETKGDIRKAFEKAHNLFASMHDGIKNGEASSEDFTEVISELQVIRKAVARAELPKEGKPRLSAEESAINDSISDSGEGRNGALFDKGMTVMKKYEKFRSLVPSNLGKKKYTSIRMPIVAVTDPLLKKVRLEKFGLCDDTIFDYPFLKNQTLLGISKAWIMENFKGQTLPAVNMILGLIQEQTKRQYIQLGSAKMRGQVTWVWVASEREMLYLNKAGGGHFKVTGWDFPFEADILKRSK